MRMAVGLLAAIAALSCVEPTDDRGSSDHALRPIDGGGGGVGGGDPCFGVCGTLEDGTICEDDLGCVDNPFGADCRISYTGGGTDQCTPFIANCQDWNASRCGNGCCEAQYQETCESCSADCWGSSCSPPDAGPTPTPDAGVECPTEVCPWLYCGPKTDVCSDGSTNTYDCYNCPSGPYYCDWDTNRCEYGECGDDLDCLPGEFCVNHDCIADDYCVPECGWGEVCIDGGCICVEECCSDLDCGWDEACFGGSCECAAECCSDWDCGGDQVCEDGQCTDWGEVCICGWDCPINTPGCVEW